jgi:complex iron-sulfur molybdoenzyme family reductase subunit beta
MSESTNGAGTSQRQLAMVFNLDKCIGCQTCTVACRTHWKVDREGADHLYNIWVETKPGEGWPKGWMDIGRKKPNWVRDYGGSWEFNLEEVYNSPAGETYLHPVAKETGEKVSYGPVWEEDRGGGEWPNGYFFYMPRMCNHCDDPVCVTACEDYCTRHEKPVAMTKRDKDGIVTIDPDLCLDCHMCIAACPYQIPMENLETKTNEGQGAYEMCDFCASRVDQEFAPVCAKSCPSRAMYFGYLDDPDSYVSKLVNEYKVALPLRPDYETGPNVYYVPPFIRPNKVGEQFEVLDEKDLPIELLREYFGEGVDQALATLKEHRDAAARGEESELMEMLIIYDFADAFTPFDVGAPTEPIEVKLEAN